MAHRFRLFPPAVVALLVGLLRALSAVAAPEPLPQGWTAHYRPGALFVPHPAGWQVQERGDGAFVVYRPGSGAVAQALVYVKPQRFGPDRNAADALGLMPREESALFPQLKVVSGTTLPGRYVGVQGELRFMVQGQPYRGLAIVQQGGASGTLFVLSATEAAWPIHARTMTEILYRFRYLSAARGDKIELQWVQWRDPLEGAFTVPVPRGWNVQGGMKRPNVLGWRPEVVVTSPDGTVSVRMGDGSLQLFAVPYSLPMIGGLPPGTRPGFAGGEFHDYLPGAQFLARYYLPRRFKQVEGLQGIDLPDLAREAFRLRPPPAPMQGRADAGAIRFEVASSAGRLIGQYVVTTHFTAPPAGISGGAGNWEVGVLSGYLCRPEREALAQAVLAELMRGYRADVQWYVRQLQIDNANAATIVAGNQQLNDMVAETNR